MNQKGQIFACGTWRCRVAAPIGLALLALLVAYALGFLGVKPPIRVGVLHSLTGTMATNEKPMVDALLLAVEEVNATGGVDGRRIEPLIVDGRSDPAHFALEADRLISREQVAAIFGCWTSACRAAVRPVVEKHNNLLVYSVQYEGMERSQNILYLGLTPNQQILPAMTWAARNLGKRAYLIGSDYIFPRTANLVIREYAAASGIDILGERYLPQGSTDFANAMDEIDQLRPDVIFNTINGDSNFAFFSALQQRSEGVADAKRRPRVMSFSLTESETIHAPQAINGHYAAWSYFQSLDTPANQAFVAAFAARYGNDRVVSDPMMTAYQGLHLWAQAVHHAGSSEPARVGRALFLNQSANTPEGVLSTDESTRHVWRHLRIAQAQKDGQFKVLWSSVAPLRPRPFPSIHTEEEWLRLLADDAVNRSLK